MISLNVEYKSQGNISYWTEYDTPSEELEAARNYPKVVSFIKEIGSWGIFSKYSLLNTLVERMTPLFSSEEVELVLLYRGDPPVFRNLRESEPTRVRTRFERIG
jgi:hypothetical protein